jgi:hypothetical protein
MLISGGAAPNAVATADSVLSYATTQPLYLYRHP